MAKNTPIHKPCDECGKVFLAKFQYSTQKHQRRCSIACYRKHQVRLWGDPVKAEARFWARVNKNGPNGCWLFTGCLDKWGYGDLQVHRKHIQAHRLAWKLLRGDPGKMDCLHKCHNPTCCNPDHLYLGDDRDNTRDRVEAGRHLFGERHTKAILTDALVLEIRSKRGTATHRELAKSYGVSQSSICHILSGRTWRHLPV
jgi:hypothetical protein